VPHALAGRELHGVQTARRRAVDVGHGKVRQRRINGSAPLDAAKAAAEGDGALVFAKDPVAGEAIEDLGIGGLASGLNISNTSATGDLGAIYRLTQSISLSARVGRSFRTPNISELFFTDAGSVSGFVVGNQHLQPVLVEAAWAAVRHEGYLKALYHRHVMKWGGYRSPTAKKKAIIVVAHGVVIRVAEERFTCTTTTGNAAAVLAWMEEWLQTEWPHLQVYLTNNGANPTLDLTDSDTRNEKLNGLFELMMQSPAYQLH
jgi:hypothetical protein